MSTATRRTAAALAATAALVVPTTLTPAAHAATAPAQAWAAYTPAPSWVGAKDTVQWYVATAPLPAAAVGKVVTITATSPKTIDCANLGAGYGTDTGWTNLAPTRARCRATSASWSFTVTKALVGKEVSLNGWTATTGRTTRINGTTRVLGRTTKVSVTARSGATVGAVGPLVRIGTWNKKAVSTASGNLANQLWLGTGRSAKSWTLPSGDIWHSSVKGDLVDIWYKTSATELDHWQLDLSTGKVTTTVVTVNRVLYEGAPGFWANETPPHSYQVDVLHDWQGNTYHSYDANYYEMRGNIRGFTDKYSVTTGYGQTATAVILEVPGGESGAWNVGLPISHVTPDATGVTLTYTDFTTEKTCRVEWASSTCPGSWGPAA